MNIADKAIFNILSQSSGTILLLLSSIVYVRFLNQTDYGTFLQVMLISNTVIMLGFLGLPQSIYYFFQTEEKKDVFVLRTLLITALLSIFFSVVLLLLKSTLVRMFDNPDLAHYYWAVWLIVSTGYLIRLREPLLWSAEKLMLSGLLTLIASLLQLGIPLAGLFWGGTVRHVLLLMVTGHVLCLLIHLSIFSKMVRDFRRERLGTCDHVKVGSSKSVGFWEQMRYALPIGLTSYSGVIGREMDKYIISGWFNPAQFAIYSRGALEVPLISSIRFTINDIMMPKFVQLFKGGQYDELFDKWHQIIEHVAKINFGIFALLFALTPTMIRILYTDAYMGAVPVFRTYLFMLIVGVAVYGMLPRVSGQTRLVLWASLLNLPLNFVLAIVLIRWVGPVGPAASTVIASAVTMFWLLNCSKRLVNRPLSKMFPWRRLSGILLIAVISSVPIYIFEAFCATSGLASLGAVFGELMVYLLMYLMLLKKYHFLSDEEKSTLSRWLRPLPIGVILQ